MPSTLLLTEDVIFEILKRCTWRDVLAARKVSRMCYAVSQSRELWVNFVLACLGQNRRKEPSIHYLDRPLHMYSTSDLECTFLRWMKIRCVWGSRTHPLRLSRQFCLPAPGWSVHNPNLTFMVPGGRWFVAFCDDGSAFYYDLDTQDAARQIIYAVTSAPVYYTTIFKPSVLTSEPYLSFYSGICYLNDSNTWFVHIWKIFLHHEETSSSPKLLADSVASFSIPCAFRGQFFIEARDIFENMAAFYTRYGIPFGPPEQRDAAVTIVDWSKATGSRFARRVILTRHNARIVNLLSQSWMLVHSLKTTTLYHYCQAFIHLQMPTYEDVVVESEIYWSQIIRSVDSEPFDSSEYFFASRPYTICGTQDNDNGDMTRQAILIPQHRGGYAIYAIQFMTRAPTTSIPSVQPSSVICLGTFDEELSGQRNFVGYNSGIVNYRNTCQKRLYYQWPDHKADLNIQHYGEQPRRSSIGWNRNGELCAFDEGTGRVITYNEVLGTMLVSDFV